MEEQRLLGSSFGVAASAFAEHRPDYARAAVDWTVELRTADSLVATLATRAGMLTMPEAERTATLGRIRAFLASEPNTSHGEFTLPMLTGVLRVRRLS